MLTGFGTLLILTFVGLGLAKAQTSNRYIVHHGRVLSPSGAPLEGNFRLEAKIYSPSPKRCLLWSETAVIPFHLGTFNYEIGKSTNRLSGVLGGAAQSFTTVFANHAGAAVSSAVCEQPPNNYSPAGTDTRNLEITLIDGPLLITVYNGKLGSAPYALESANANMVGGYEANFIFKYNQVAAHKPSLTFSTTGASVLWDFAETTAPDLGGKQLKNLLEPTDPSDAATLKTIDDKLAAFAGGTLAMGVSRIDAVSASTGVLNISGAPITSTGTLNFSFVSQNMGMVFAAPTGSAGVPSFRMLEASDIPNIGFGQVTGTLGVNRGGTGLGAYTPYALLAANMTGDAIEQRTCLTGEILVWQAGTGWTCEAKSVGTGSVTHVGFEASTIFDVTGGPITSAGTIGLQLAPQARNLVLASPTGATGAPTFRSLAGEDLPIVAGTGIALSLGSGALEISTIAGTTGLSQWSNVANGIQYSAGSVGVGVTAPSATFHVQDNNGSNQNAQYVSRDILSNAPNAATFRGIDTRINLSGSGNFTDNTSGNSAYYGQINHFGTGNVTGVPTVGAVAGVSVNRVAGTMTNATGLSSYIRNVSTGSIGTAYGVYSHLQNGAGTIGTAYGLYVDAIGTFQNLFGVYVNRGNSYFGGNVGIGTTSPTAVLDIASNGSLGSAIRIPQDTTINRPTVSAIGMMRYNTDLGKYEVYEGTGWMTLATAAGSTSTSQWTNVANGIHYSSGSVGIGTASPSSKLEVAEGGILLNSATTFPILDFIAPNTGAYQPVIKFRGGRSNNTAYPLTGNILGQISFKNKDDMPSAQIFGHAAENQSASASGGFLSFRTTPNGGTTDFERMRIIDSGFVGIGTGVPIALIDATNSSNATYGTIGTGNYLPGAAAQRIMIRGTLGVTGVGSYFGLTTSNPTNNQSAYLGAVSTASDFSPHIVLGVQTGTTSFAERMRLASNGMVGIGVSQPTAILDLASNGTLGSAIRIPQDTTANRPSAAAIGMMRYNTDLGKYEVYEGSNWMTLATSVGSASVSQWTNGTNGISYSGGSVGIGTASPVATLDVAGTVRTTSSAEIGSDLTIGTNYNADVTLGFQTNFGNQRSAKIVKSFATPYDWSFYSSNGANANAYRFFTDDGTTGAKLSILGNGNVGIGTANPDVTLQVMGPGRVEGSDQSIGFGVMNKTSTVARYPALFVENYAGGANGLPALTLINHRGSNTSPSALALNQRVGRIDFRSGFGTTGVARTSAAIDVNVTETPSDTNGGTSMSFLLVPRGTNVTATRMYIDDRGRVGLNTLAPAVALDVTTLGSFGSAIRIPSDNTATRPSAATVGMIRYNTDLAKYEVYENSGWMSLATASGTLGTSPWLSGTSGIYYSSGSVGIGTSSPTAAFQIDYGLSLNTFVVGSTTKGFQVRDGGSDIDLNATGGYRLVLGSNVNSRTILATGTNSRVGIGTLNPTTGLDIALTGTMGSAIRIPRDSTANRPNTPGEGMMRYNTDTLRYEVYDSTGWVNLASGTSGTSQWITGTLGISYVDGSVGIGTTTPGANLHIRNLDATAGTQVETLRLESNNNAIGAGPFMKFRSVVMTDMGRVSSMDTGGFGAALTFSTKSADGAGSATNASAERMRIDAAGNVGIGTTGPTALLHLVKNANSIQGITVGNTDAGGSAVAQINLVSDAVGTTLRSYSTAGGGVTQLQGNGNAVVIKSSNATGKIRFENSVGTSQMTLDTTTGNMSLGAGTVSGSVILDLASNGTLGSALRLPRDSTSARPTNSGVGMMRYNTDSNRYEVYDSTGWVNLAVGSGTLAQGAWSQGGDAFGQTGTIGTNDNNSLVLRTNGSNAVTIGTNGRVGIGVAPSGYSLSVQGTIQSTYNVLTSQFTANSNSAANSSFVSYLSTGTTNQKNFDIYHAADSIDLRMMSDDYGSGQTAIRMRRSGANVSNVNIPFAIVGIGTDSPTAALDVASTGSRSAIRFPRATTATRPTGTLASDLIGMMRYNTDNSKYEVYEGSAWVNLSTGTSGTSQWANGASGISYASGSVGVGTTTPAYLMEVRQNQNAITALQVGNWNANAAASAAVITAADTVSASMTAYGSAAGDTGQFTSTSNLTLRATGASKSMRFDTNGANERMRIDGTGNVGINTVSPIVLLDIASNGTLGSAIRLPRDTTARRPSVPGVGMMRYNTDDSKYEVYEATGWASLNTSSGTTSGSQWTNASNGIAYAGGSVAIGYSSPSARLDVAGNIRVNNGQYILRNVAMSESSDSLIASAFSAMAVAPTSGDKDSVLRIIPSGTATKSVLEIFGDSNVGTSHIASIAATTTGMTIGHGSRSVPISFLQSNSPVMTIAGNGRTGVGTASPSSLLHVLQSGTPSGTLSPASGDIMIVQNDGAAGNTSSLYVTAGDAGGANLYFGDGTNPKIGGVSYYNGTDTLYLRTSNIDRLIINGNGNAGVGASTPTVGFDVATTGTLGSALRIPRDSTLNRPVGSAPADLFGMMRFNTDLSKYEVYEGSGWMSIATGSGTASASQWLTGSTGISYSGGNVGIGVTSPSTALDINTNVNSSGSGIQTTNSNSGTLARSVISARNDGSQSTTIGITSSGFTPTWLSASEGFISSAATNGLAIGALSTIGSIRFLNGSNSAPTEKMRITSGGLVGIGTNNPTSLLTVAGTTAVHSLSINGGTVSTNTNLAVADGRTSLTWTGTQSVLTVKNDSSATTARVADFLRNRNGTTAPGVGFAGDVALQLEGFTNGSSPDAALLTYGWESAQSNDTTDRDSYLSISTMKDNASAERLRINSDGFVGIGTTTPVMPLHVIGTTQSTNFRASNGTPTGASYTFAGDADTGIYHPTDDIIAFSTAGVHRMRIIEDGKIGIGTTAPSYELDVVGTIRASTEVRSPLITQTSDARFKRNIASLPDALNKIMKLRGVSYDWRSNEFPEKHFSDRNQIGLIAQEVEQVYPELVVTDKDGYKAVNYSGMVAPLIEATHELYGMCKSQDERITQLEAENAELKKETAEMRKELDLIKAKLGL